MIDRTALSFRCFVRGRAAIILLGGLKHALGHVNSRHTVADLTLVNDTTFLSLQLDSTYLFRLSRL